MEKHPRHTRQVLVEDCSEVPSLLTATGRSFSQNNMPSVASDSSRVLLTMIDKASDGCGDLRQRIGLAFE